jgi:hypothetical protein
LGDAQRRFQSSWLAQIANQLEKEVVVTSIFGTNNIEGDTLSEQETQLALASYLVGSARPLIGSKGKWDTFCRQLDFLSLLIRCSKHVLQTASFVCVDSSSNSNNGGGNGIIQ